MRKTNNSRFYRKYFDDDNDDCEGVSVNNESLPMISNSDDSILEQVVDNENQNLIENTNVNNSNEDSDIWEDSVNTETDQNQSMSDTSNVSGGSELTIIN